MRDKVEVPGQVSTSNNILLGYVWFVSDWIVRRGTHDRSPGHRNRLMKRSSSIRKSLLSSGSGGRGSEEPAVARGVAGAGFSAALLTGTGATGDVHTSSVGFLCSCLGMPSSVRSITTLICWGAVWPAGTAACSPRGTHVSLEGHEPSPLMPAIRFDEEDDTDDIVDRCALETTVPAQEEEADGAANDGFCWKRRRSPRSVAADGGSGARRHTGEGEPLPGVTRKT